MTSTDSKNEKMPTNAEYSSERGLGIRHMQVGIMALAAFVSFPQRMGLSVAIVAIVNETTTLVPDTPTYNWDGKIQGYIHSAFFWGYLIAQIPAGLLSEKFGGHRILCAAVLGSSIMSLFFSYCASIGGWELVCINRVLQGVFQGFLFPSFFNMLGVWSPPAERSRFSSILVGATLFGTVVALSVSGHISYEYGWPTCFYIFGSVGIGAAVIMIILGGDSPSSHRMISKGERIYIQSSLGGDKRKLPVPWKEVCKCVPYYAAVLGYASRGAVIPTLTTEIPTYLGTSFDFDMATIGIISAVPALTSGLLLSVESWLCDFMIGKKWVSVTIARKAFNSVGCFGTACFLVLLAHAEDKVLCVVFLTLAMGIESCVYVGLFPSFVDLAPNFSGAIFGVANFLAYALTLWGPNVVGLIVTEKGSAAQWRIVFYLCAALMATGNVVFIIWGSAETQWWNWPEKYKSKKEYIESVQKEKTVEPEQRGTC